MSNSSNNELKLSTCATSDSIVLSGNGDYFENVEKHPIIINETYVKKNSSVHSMTSCSTDEITDELQNNNVTMDDASKTLRKSDARLSNTSRYSSFHEFVKSTYGQNDSIDEKLQSKPESDIIDCIKALNENLIQCSTPLNETG